ncbi:hypothetical protein D3C78_729570 [compost metagenome]
MRDHFTQRTKDLGDVDLVVEKRGMELLQVEADRRVIQVETALSADIATHGDIDVVEYGLADGIVTEQLAVALRDDFLRDLRIVMLIRLEQRQAQRGEHLEVQLLTQDHVLGADRFIATQP